MDHKQSPDSLCNNPSTEIKSHSCTSSRFLSPLKYLFLFVLCWGLLHSSYLIFVSKSSSVEPVPVRPHPRVLCLINTYAGGHELFGTVVQRTWARQCDRVLFISNEEHWSLEPIVFRNKESWGTVKAGLEYVHRYHFDEANWFLKADHDQFVNLENLRKLLKSYSPEQPITLGFKAKDRDNLPYMMGSYVISKEAFQRFIKLALHNSSICYEGDTGIPNEEMGRCLRNVGVIHGDSRDAIGRQRFIPFSPQKVLSNWTMEQLEWYSEHSYYNVSDGKAKQLPPDIISFMNVDPALMMSLHYMIYKMRIFGRTVPGNDSLAESILQDKEL